MEHKIPCEIIQDLMPLYVDNLTSDLTNTEIENHFNSCADCKSQYAFMKSTEGSEKSERDNNFVKEIDYLKKINIYQKRNLILGSIISFLFGMALPILMATLPIMITLIRGGEIPPYIIERLNAIWYVVVIKVGTSGLIVCALYLIINLFFWKLKSKQN